MKTVLNSMSFTRLGRTHRRALLGRVVVLEKMRMGIGDEMLGNIERFLLLVSHDDVLSALPSNVAPGVEDLPWTAERLTKLGSAIYTMIQGYTDKAIVVTSSLLSWVTHFTLQVRVPCPQLCSGLLSRLLGCHQVGKQPLRQ